MSARLRVGRAIASAIFSCLLVVSQAGRVDAQGNGNGNGVANRVAALESEVASLAARVAALENTGTERKICLDLIADSAPPSVTTPLFVGRVMLSTVQQGTGGFHNLVGAAIDWEFGGASYPGADVVFDPLYGSAYVTSTGNLRLGFFVATEAPRFQEVRGLLNGPLFQTGAFSLRSTDEDNVSPGGTADYFGHVAAATCPARPE